ncbi:MAG: DegT/DnrJ/EryC1/StrS family aminotransferase [Magnetococcales bacterium]|nr:DegT/DnrJ/EryC1/StrS family aminotransferase [Magnetococcales bacterium]MBF0321491.1 DegT/DnrJ/EryC1/StrS family aminotransferase [Magnetococcales bacterium]
MTSRRDIPFGRPDIDDADRQAVLEVLQQHVLTHGPQCKAFEVEFAAFVGAPAAVTVSSCMAALHLSHMHLGIGPGDEVIVPAQTHVATVHAVELTGAKPVFVDCEIHTGNVDLALVEKAISPRTRAVTVVHFAGIPANMARLRALADAHRLKVIEDCALAVGARFQGRHVGLWGKSGCFSFYPVKHMTTGEGGMLISCHTDELQEMANFRAFNVDRSANRPQAPGVYDVAGVGLNYRMSEMAAALGRSQLRKMPRFLAARAANFHTLQSRLRDIPGLQWLDADGEEAQSSHYCLVAMLPGKMGDKRSEVVERLKEFGVGVSVYYPQPTPRMSYYRNRYGYDARNFPHAEIISDRSIALPVGPHLDATDMHYMGDRLAQLAGEMT